MSSGRLVFGLGAVLYKGFWPCLLFHTEPLESPGNTRAFSAPYDGDGEHRASNDARLAELKLLELRSS